jgi:hypothetical protein
MGNRAREIYERAAATADADGRLALPGVAEWDTFPFEGELRVRPLEEPAPEPPRVGEDPADCHACTAPDSEYLWTNERWRLGPMRAPSGLPVVVILYPRAHVDLGDLDDELAAELGVLTVRIERAIRSLDGIGRVHVGRWGDGSAHCHVWYFGRPAGLLQLRGSFAAIWDDVLPPADPAAWRADLDAVATALAAGGGTVPAARS